MKLKKNRIQLLSGSFLAMLALLTLLMARYGELPGPSLLSDESIMVALGVSTSRTL